VHFAAPPVTRTAGSRIPFGECTEEENSRETMKRRLSILLYIMCVVLCVALAIPASAACSRSSQRVLAAVRWEENAESLQAHTVTPDDWSVEEFLTELAEECSFSPKQKDDLASALPDTDGFLQRWEAAVLLWSAMQERGEEALPAEETDGAPWKIPDYESIPASARQAVMEVYGRGILSEAQPEAGERKGVFHPGDRMTAEECEEVLARLTENALRVPRTLVDDNPYRVENAPNGTTPMAIWLQENGYLNGTQQTAQFRELFFGDSTATRFYEDSPVAEHAMLVTLNIWQVNENGEKVPATYDLWVHKLLAADIYDIFQQIFEDEEQFPIYLMGCAGFEDDMCHAWLAAIDINSEYNALENNALGRVVTAAGRGWWPKGTARTEWASFLTEDSIYSIPADGSVVRAFEDYGWHWGGDWNEAYRDFMHFSILPDGG